MVIFRWLQKRQDKKQHALLSFLAHRGEVTGLDMVNGCNGLFKRGVVYEYLFRMHKLGYVHSQKRPLASRWNFVPPLSVHHFSLTQKGRERLTQLGEPLSTYR